MLTKDLIRIRKRKKKRIKQLEIKRASVEQVKALTKKITSEYDEVFNMLADASSNHPSRQVSEKVRKAGKEIIKQYGILFKKLADS